MAEKIPMIALSPTMEEGTILRWAKAEGDVVAAGDLLCEVETDKAAMDYESPAAGTLLKILVPAGGRAKVAEPIAILGRPGEDISALLAEAAQAAASGPPPRGQESPPPAAPAAPEADRGHVRASPLARRVARERGIDIHALRGSGPAGRVVLRDVEAAAMTPKQPVAAPPAGDELVPVAGKRKVIAQRLSESKSQAPHYYLTISLRMDEVLAARARLNEGRETKVSFNAFMHKLVAEALKRHPEVNSSWEGEKIRRFGRIDIGLAVALPDGLITPVVRDCGSKGILEIDRELTELIEKARAGRLTPQEYTGATFTVSNLGSFGIEEFTAIINPPGSAILALGQVHRAPVVEEGDRIVVRSLMRATLSCDHRVIDGAVGAAFLSSFKDLVENPLSALY